MAVNIPEHRLWSVNTVSCWVSPEFRQEILKINWRDLFVPEGREGGIPSKGYRNQFEGAPTWLMMEQFEHQNKTKLIKIHQTS